MKKYTIKIKDGYKATDIETYCTGSEIKVSYKETPIWEPKHGEIVALKYMPNSVFIYDSRGDFTTSFIIGITHNNKIFCSDKGLLNMLENAEVTSATPKQKERLQNAIKEKYNRIWDEEKCELVKIPKSRVKFNGKFYYINFELGVNQTTEVGGDVDDHLFEVNNYFKTEKEAQRMADKIKQLLSEE